MTLPPVTALQVIRNRWIKRIRPLSRLGWPRVAYLLAQRICDPRHRGGWMKFGLVELYRVEVAQLQRPVRFPSSWEIRRADARDRQAVETLFENTDGVRKRFARGDLCFVTSCNNEIGAAVWLTCGPGTYGEDWDQLRCSVKIPSSVGWSFDGRGVKLGAWGALMARLPTLLRPYGVREIYTLIDYDNQRSIDSHLSLGYQRVGLLTRLGLGRWGLTRLTSPEKRWGRLPRSIGDLELLATE